MLSILKQSFRHTEFTDSLFSVVGGLELRARREGEHGGFLHTVDEGGHRVVEGILCLPAFAGETCRMNQRGEVARIERMQRQVGESVVVHEGEQPLRAISASAEVLQSLPLTVVCLVVGSVVVGILQMSA